MSNKYMKKLKFYVYFSHNFKYPKYVIICRTIFIDKT